MALYMIAKLSYRGEHVGYRILDDVSQKTKDVNISSVTACLRNNICICNIELDGDIIKGTQGSLDRYAVYELVNDNTENQPLVILGKVLGGYKVSNKGGNIKDVKESDLIKYAKLFGLANGKIVEKEGTEYISAINGEYRTLEFTKNEANVTKRFVVLGIVHGINDISKTISAMYFDMHTMKKMSMQIMNRYRKSIDRQGNGCELYETKDRGLQEIHRDVYEIDSRSIVRNKSKYKNYDWYKCEVVICRVSEDNGYYKYLLGDRLNNKTREVNLLAILKEIKNGNSKIVVTVKTEGNKLIVKSATDEYAYDLELIKEQLNEYKVNVENTILKLDVLGIRGMEIDAAGRLIKLDFDSVDRTREIKIPECVVELSRHSLGVKYSNGSIDGLLFKDTIKKVDRHFMGGRLYIGVVRSDSVEVCRAISSRSCEAEIGSMYCPKDVDDAIIARMCQKVKKEIYVGESKTIEDGRALKVLKNLIKKSNIDDVAKTKYVVQERYYIRGIQSENIIIDLDDIELSNVNRGFRAAYNRLGNNCVVGIEYRNIHEKKNDSAMMRFELSKNNFKKLTTNVQLIEKMEDVSDRVNSLYLRRSDIALENLKIEKQGEVVVECGESYPRSREAITLKWYRFTYADCIDSFGNRFLARTKSEYIGELPRVPNFKDCMRYANVIVTGKLADDIIINSKVTLK